MKKILFLLSFTMISIFTNAQTHKAYCELLGTGNFLGTKVTVTVDFGQKVSFWTGKAGAILVDTNGNPIRFNTMIDAMDYMGKFGWVFVQAYVVTVSKQNVYHWLLSKEVINDDEITEGFKTQKQYKDEHKKDKSKKSDNNNRDEMYN